MVEMHRAIIADDEDGVLELLGDVLKAEGIEVEFAHNGREALDAHARRPASLILTDLVMPIMTGQELLRTLRERGDDVPIIVITGHATLDDAILAIRLGAFDLVTKPFSLKDVRSVVREALGVGEMLRSAEQDVLAMMREGSLPEGISLANLRAVKQLAFLKRMRESTYFSEQSDAG